MSAVWMRVRAELRARWRAWLGLALAFGLAGGAATAAAAGARRAETAYPRFVEAQRAYHVVLGGIGADDGSVFRRIRERIAALPQVEDSAFSEFVSDTVEFPRTGAIATFPDVAVFGDPTGRDGYEISAAKAIEGRLADRTRPDEATIDWIAADRLGLSVGDEALVRLSEFEEGSEEPRIVRAPVTIVGVAIGPGSLPAVGQTTFGVLAVTPAFIERHRELIQPSNDAPSVRLKNGVADIPAFLAGLRQLPREVDVPYTLPQHLQGVKETLRFEVVGLWALAALIALAAAAILGQTLARQAYVEAAEYPRLRALGMSRRALTVVGILRASAIAVMAAGVGVVVAILGSVLTPIGLSRLVEPDPGVAIDGTVLATGLAVTFLAIPLLAVWPAWRAAGLGGAEVPSSARPNRAVVLLAGASVSAATLTGVRLALEPGRGARATPVRTAVLGSLIGVAALAASLTFAASLQHLIRTPELYGFNWDFIADMGDDQEALALLEADPDVEAISHGGAFSVLIEDRSLLPFVYEPGAIGPTMLEGSAPDAPDEIALGSQLARALDVAIGDEVAVTLGGDESQRGGQPPPTVDLRVVGTTVVPAFFFQQVPPGEGAALTMQTLYENIPDELREGTPLIVRYLDGVDIHAKLGALRDRLPFVFAFQVRQPGSDLISLVRVEDLPVGLAGLLAFMAVATLVHALVTSVRRRRRDLAVLKTIGFVGRQIRGAVAWQSSTLTLIALVAGLPLGIAAGRWGWSLFATDLGVLDVPRSPAIALALIVPGTLLLANAVAALPARAAARTKAAVVLRSE
jgi:hypothetical protein